MLPSNLHTVYTQSVPSACIRSLFRFFWPTESYRDLLLVGLEQRNLNKLLVLILRKKGAPFYTIEWKINRKMSAWLDAVMPSYIHDVDQDEIYIQHRNILRNT